ncbi:hypothetical protein QOZ80_6BG0492930 [Eleusine coracana subsp. coracana]|nr:hypothetical protein QOZ80_6BG0492930 [Eleusine coracana subsp. coracana]
MGAKENGEERNNHSNDVERDSKQGKEAESDYEPSRDSLSSQGEANEDIKVKRVSRVPKKLTKKESKESSPRSARSYSNRQIHTKLQYISSNNSWNKSPKSNKVTNGTKIAEVKRQEIVKVPSCSSSESSEETDDKAIDDRPSDDKAFEAKTKDDKAIEARTKDDNAIEASTKDDNAIEASMKDDNAIEDISKDDNAAEVITTADNAIEDISKDDKAVESIATDDKAIEGKVTDDKVTEGRETDDIAIEEPKEIDVLDEAPKSEQSTGTDDDIADAEESIVSDGKLDSYRKNEELDSRIEKLEQELREVAALEVSLYSVVPEHGCSSHKLHTPARRLSRLYIHASKFWTSDKKASVAKNSVSGLVLIAKSCGNDVSRLTFWLSNTVVLREIVTQTFGISRQSSPIMKVFSTNGIAKSDKSFSPVRWKSNSNGKHAKPNIMQMPDDWRETGTLLAALERIESWVFSRIVESVWWQAMTPHMQTPVEDISTPKVGSLLQISLGDQQHGNFSIGLWKSAFRDAFSKICPLRAGGHECGCLPVLAKLVMEHCVARLDVAMFNAILRESANEIPSDPISDPIIDSRVLPIAAGDLSFGSGAQLKNSVGNWSRWLTDTFGMDAAETEKDGSDEEDNCDDRRDVAESSCFKLLNELSDLLMLPKDMLLEKSIRKEVCPSIGLPLVTRILCNFTPDEFCPDPVPGMVLEELNSESLRERFTDKDKISTFPVTAAPVVYCPPSVEDVAEKVADTGCGNAELDRKASMVQRRGYTSDDDLDDLDSPLASLYDKSAPPSPCNGVAHFSSTRQGDSSIANARYELLREVWSDRR